MERDERWHIGFGVRCLIESEPTPELIDDLVARAEDAAGAWGDAVPAPRASAPRPRARRRLSVAHLHPHARGGVGASGPVAAAPSVRRRSLSRVGLTGVEKVIHLGVDRRSAAAVLGPARLLRRARPAPTAHAPRFEEAIRDAVRESSSTPRACAPTGSPRRSRSGCASGRRARRAEVTIAARFPERRPAPVSGTPTQEISTLHARAVASARGTRRMVGVSAQGMTTSPHAQAVLAARSRERLAAGGFSHAQIDRVLEHVPVATHEPARRRHAPPRLPRGLRARLRRRRAARHRRGGDVERDLRAHEAQRRGRGGRARAPAAARGRRLRAGDDRRRRRALRRTCPTTAFVSAAQENIETIHRHTVTAECAGLLGELRRELPDRRARRRRTSMRRWLEADGG